MCETAPAWLHPGKADTVGTAWNASEKKRRKDKGVIKSLQYFTLNKYLRRLLLLHIFRKCFQEKERLNMTAGEKLFLWH